MNIYICVHLCIQLPNQIIDHFQQPAGSLPPHVAVWVFLEVDSAIEFSAQDISCGCLGSIPVEGRKEAGLGRKGWQGVMQGPQLLPHPQEAQKLKGPIKIVLNRAKVDSPLPLYPYLHELLDVDSLWKSVTLDEAVLCSRGNP